MNNASLGPGFTLQDFETQVNRGIPESSIDLLLQLMKYVDNATTIETVFVDPDDPKCSDAYQIGFQPFSNKNSFFESSEYCNRLASAISTLLSTQELKLNRGQVTALVFYKAHLAAIFAASSFRSMDHILVQRGIANDQLALNIQGKTDFEYLLICHNLNSKITVDYTLFFDFDNELASFHYLAMLYQIETLRSEQAENNRFQLINDFHLIDRIPPHRELLDLIANPWMLITYFDNPNKHRVKEKLNALITRIIDKFFDRKTLKQIEKNVKGKANGNTMVIAMEKYNSKHAMYRCYKSTVSLLQQHFRVILAVQPADIDRVAQQDFDEIIFLSPAMEDLEKNALSIAKYQPDIIWYPSLGMSKWAPVFCNMRLAPNQVMALGHPASSFAKEVDYLLAYGHSQPGSTYQEHASEKVIDIHFTDRHYVKPDNFPSKIPQRLAHPGVINLAINSSELKITTQFLMVCQIIKGLSKRPLHFHFFQLKRNSFFPIAFEREIRERLGSVTYHRFADYPTYLSNLAQCDLALGTFPFGGTNTNVDLVLLGIPKIIIGRPGDFAEVQDEDFFRQIEAPDETIACNEDDYIRKALLFIQDDQLREHCSQQLRQINIFEDIQFSEESSAELVEALLSICNLSGRS